MAKNNEPLSSLTHLIGFAVAIASLVLMVVFAALYGSASRVLGAVLFGASMILLYAASTLYHFFSEGSTAKKVFQRIDHAMIFVLIAGTYTPLVLVMPDRVWGWLLFGIVWGIAALGITLKSCGLDLRNRFSTVLYLVMGWLVVIAWPVIVEWLSVEARAWLIAGGVLYSIGVVFYALDSVVKRTKWWGLHEVFHLFVMAGSFAHFWFMLRFVLVM